MTTSGDHRVEETLSSITYFEDGIIITEVKDDGMIDLAEARRISETFVTVTGDREAPVLVDFGKMKQQTKEARDFFSKDLTHLSRFAAAALLVKNPMAKVFANFYMGINRPAKPTRMFTDKRRALEWLQQFK